MSDLTPREFLQRIADLNLASRRDVEQAMRNINLGNYDLKDVIRVCQSGGLVTTLQTDKILNGDRTGFFYGDYKVLYLIGAGTFARVYRAEKDGEVFAVKVLRKRFRDEPKEMEQFLREGRMGLKLRHPHIVEITDVVPDVRSPFLVMEFVEGQTLRELVKLRGKLPFELATRLIHEVASGLAYASSFGIAHRDLKLSNVLISSEGTAKLVDFGLAALTDRQNPEKVADCPNARAIDYAALERGTNVRKDDPRSDIYFAGNMYYHMLAGRPALSETRDRLARLNISRFQTIPPVTQYAPDVPGVCLQLLQRMLEFNPEKRIQSAAAMQAEAMKVIKLLERGPVKKVIDGKVTEVHPDDVDDPTDEGEGYVVMFVESKQNLQDAVRQRLKARGYRVLITNNPRTAVNRFEMEQDLADCVIFGASELGMAAVEAFNDFAERDATADIPTILMVDRRQSHLLEAASRGDNRTVLPLPLKVRELRGALKNALASTPKRELGTY